MGSRSKIYVKEGGKLIVDGGLIKNANVIVQTGCELVLKNNGVLEKDFNDELVIDTGGTFDFTNGEIKLIFYE